MRIVRKIIMSLIIIIIGIEIGLAYTAYQILSTSPLLEAALLGVETMTIQADKRSIVMSGQIKTKETKTEYYDVPTYGRYLDAKVQAGAYVREGDVLIEASRRLYRAPFTGYVTEINAEAAYNQARRAAANGTTIENPIVLYTMVSDDYYIESALTEYEINRLPEQQAIKYSIRAGDKDKYHDASIRLISSLPENNIPVSVKKPDISNYTLTLNMDSGKENARVGNHVTIRIHDTAPPTFFIPLNAVIKENNRTYVYLIKEIFKDTIEENGTMTTRETAIVTKKEIVGTQFNGKFRVQSGLIVGDIVATTNVVALGEEMLVRLLRGSEQ